MLFGVTSRHKCSSIRTCNNLEFFEFFLLLNKCSLGVVSPSGVSNPPIGCPFDNLSAHRARSLCRKPLFRAPVADSVTTFEFFTPLGVIADWAFFFGLMHPAKIPILLAVGAAVSGLFDSLADGRHLLDLFEFLSFGLNLRHFQTDFSISNRLMSIVFSSFNEFIVFFRLTIVLSRVVSSILSFLSSEASSQLL